MSGAEGLSEELLLSVCSYSFERHDLKTADAFAQRTLAEFPSSLDAALFIADVQSSRLRYDLARQALVDAAAFDRTLDEQNVISLRIAAVDIPLGRFDEAWETYNRLGIDSLDYTNSLNAAACAAHRNDRATADRIYASLVDKFDDDGAARTLITIARDQITHHHRESEALRILSPSLSHPESAPTAALEVAYRAHILSQQFDEAILVLRIVIDREDASPESHRALAELLDLRGDYREAIPAYLRANAHKSSAFARYRAGVLRIQTTGDYRTALNDYLAPYSFPRNLAAKYFVGEVDQRIPALRRKAANAVEPAERQEALERLLPLLSQRETILQVGLDLANLLRESESPDDLKMAWKCIASSQTRFLPAIALRHSGRMRSLTVSAVYAEMRETLPIDENVVLWESNFGDTTSCNPLALSLALLNNPAYKHIVHVWTVTSMTEVHPSLLHRDNVRFVINGSQGYLRTLATAQFLVTNSHLPWFVTKRDGQRLLETWHGIPWKALGIDKSTENVTFSNMSRTALQADVIIAPDQHTMNVLTRSTHTDALTTATLMRTDYPRNDLAVNLTPERRQEIRELLGVPRRNRLVLHMPTWRGTYHDRVAEVDETLQRTKELNGRGYTVALRAHHYVRESFDGASPPADVTFVPETIDTYELLGAADALVSDYSSVLIDAAVLGVPVIKIIGDIDQYREERGLYFTEDEVPGVNVQNAQEARRHLRRALKRPTAFTAAYAEVTARFGDTPNGTAAENVAAVFFSDATPKHTFPRTSKKGPSILLHAGGLDANGLTSSLTNLAVNLHGHANTHVLADVPALVNASADTVERLVRSSRVLPRSGSDFGTRMEREIIQLVKSGRYVPHQITSPLLRRASRREADRIFGDSKFDIAIDFVGYAPWHTSIFALGLRERSRITGFVLHNDFVSEIDSRFPRLSSTVHLLPEFDFVASVSDGVREKNAIALAERYGIDTSRFSTLPNTLDLERMRSLAAESLDDASAKWYASPGRHIVLPGRFSPEKNHVELLQALREYLDLNTGTDLRITFLGDGPTRPEVERLTSQLHLEHHIRFAGQVANPFSHLTAADALILPSKHEGQPMVLLEALTLGTPAVATDIPGSRSVLQNGELGLLVEVSPAGLLEALTAIANDVLVTAEAFDPEKYNQTATNEFLTLIEGNAHFVAG